MHWCRSLYVVPLLLYVETLFKLKFPHRQSTLYTRTDMTPLSIEPPHDSEHFQKQNVPTFNKTTLLSNIKKESQARNIKDK